MQQRRGRRRQNAECTERYQCAVEAENKAVVAVYSAEQRIGYPLERCKLEQIVGGYGYIGDLACNCCAIAYRYADIGCRERRRIVYTKRLRLVLQT